MTSTSSFDPSRHLSLVNGKEYLEVKWRLVWLRNEHPDAVIETELYSHANQEAVFRAKVSIPGGGYSSGWGSENAQGFGDYLEKAETKAIGRALAGLGFGTQFCADFDFGASIGRVVDAPVAMPLSNLTEVKFEQPRPAADSAASERQRRMIQSIAKELKLSRDALETLSREKTGQSFDDISRRNASVVIDQLQELRARSMQSA